MYCPLRRDLSCGHSLASINRNSAPSISHYSPSISCSSPASIPVQASQVMYALTTAPKQVSTATPHVLAIAPQSSPAGIPAHASVAAPYASAIALQPTAAPSKYPTSASSPKVRGDSSPTSINSNSLPSINHNPSNERQGLEEERRGRKGEDSTNNLILQTTRPYRRRRLDPTGGPIL